MTDVQTYDFAGLGIEDFYKPVIPDPPAGVPDQGDPYLLKVPDPSATAYPYYLVHTDGSHEGDRIPVYGSPDLRRFDYLGKALPTDVAMSEHWAPCVVFCPSTGLYSMFYSRSRPDQPDPDIGQVLRRAVAERPEGPFEDQGEFPLQLESDFAIDVEMYERRRSMPWREGKRDWAGGETVDWHCIEAPIGGLVSPAGRRCYLTSFGSYKDDTYAVGAVREEADGSWTDLAGEGHAVLRTGMLPGIES